MFFNFISVVCSKYIEQALIYLIEHFSGSTDQHYCLKNKTGCRGNLASCGRDWSVGWEPAGCVTLMVVEERGFYYAFFFIFELSLEPTNCCTP